MKTSFLGGKPWVDKTNANVMGEGKPEGKSYCLGLVR